MKDSYVIINQCNYTSQSSYFNKIIINTPERGLSKSRNLALKYANANICLICDDDEILNSDYSAVIKRAFDDNPKADIIAFKIANTDKTYPSKKKSIGYIGALKLASWQLAFKRESIINKGITFDETLGSGVSKAGGEENLFLYDCLKHGLKIIYVPLTIGKMIDGESQWFHGYTEAYFYDRGIMTRKLMGKPLATIYAFYYLIRKYQLYKNDISPFKSLKNILQGIFS